MLKNQKYGVEIEMTGISRGKAAEVVAEVLRGRISGPASGCYHTRTITDNSGRDWKVMRDSSIVPQPSNDEYRVEFVTPPLKYEDLTLLQEIVRKLRENGAKANSSCGIHIHVDGANHNAESLRRIVGFMTARQELVNDALNNSGRARWCECLSPELIKTMKKEKNPTIDGMEKIWYSRANSGYTGGIDHQHYNSTRYHGLNLHAFFSKGTVEFRLFNSTLHAGKIKAYIQFCLAVSAWAITSDDKYNFKSLNGYTPEKKVTLMRNVLTKRLGLYGDEFKTCRLWMMDVIKRNAGMNSRHAA